MKQIHIGPLHFTLAIILIMLGVQILATALAAPLVDNGIAAFGDNPDSLANPFIYLGVVILLSIGILAAYKFGLDRLVSAVIFAGVWSSIFLVVGAMFLKINLTDGLVVTIVPFVVATACVVLLWIYPEWYVIDFVGFFMCTGVVAVLGVSFGVIPSIILLLIFALYDAISVYKTKHMLKLAESVLTSKLPALFIIPRTKNFSFREKATWTDLDDREKRPAYIIGLGDIVIPSLLVISASMFINGPRIWIFSIPALGAMIGSYVGLVGLQWLAKRYPQTHAGLPMLNFFTIAGFLAVWVLVG